MEDSKDARIAYLENLIEKLVAENAELKRRLNLNSSNSSMPSSSDGLRKKPSPKSLREKTDKKFGGQKGHIGDTLKQVSNPDKVIIYEVETCSLCNDSLSGIPVSGVIERQETDVIITKRIIAHKANIKICKCGKKNIGIMPEYLKSPAQYGSNVRAISVYLTNQFISKDRIAEFFRDVFQMPISDTTLLAYDAECAYRLSNFNIIALEELRRAKFKNLDESGLRIVNQTQWLHVISTPSITHYRIDKKRGSLPVGLTGIVVHDHWKPYFTLENVQHALCNAHHLRELKAIYEIDKEFWADNMSKLLVQASRYENPSQEQIKNATQLYDTIVQQGLTFHITLKPFKKNSCKRRPGHNLLLRLQKFKTETLRFLNDQSVPFTNNLAERDLRMMKLRQKVSGCFRTELGAHNFATIRSFVSTIKKQKLGVLHALNQAINNTFDFTTLIHQ